MSEKSDTKEAAEPAKPRHATRVYLGAVDEVHVRLLPSRTEILVARGEAVEMDADDAEYLEGHPEWLTPAEAKKVSD